METFKQQIAKIKEAYNIVDVVEQENISLKVSGPGEFKGLCPFHNEKTPSFKVSEGFQNYYCFGCGASGDVISFIKETHGCSMSEAMKYLADGAGIQLSFERSAEEDNQPKIDLRKMYSLVQAAHDFYRAEFDKLPDNHPAKKQVLDRGMSTDNPVFGYAPERYGALYKHLKALGYSDELMVQSELIGTKDGNFYDFFHARLTVTLADFNGKPGSFSARKLFDSDSRGKWVNGKASPVFQKKATLFNLHNAKKVSRLKKEIILAEGPFDVLALAEGGFENSVASCGTAFTEEHLKTARQLVGESGQLIFAFDGDGAGIEAALKIFKHFPVAHGISTIALFPEGQDPCDYLQSAGSEGVREIIENATPITDFVITQVANEYKMTDMNTRYKFIQALVNDYLVLVQDKILLDYMIRKASVMSGLDINKIRALLSETKKNSTKRQITKEKQADETFSEMKIEINSMDESDLYYVNAFAMLIENPVELIPLSKGKAFPKKFAGFLVELKESTKKYVEKGENFRLLPEEYTDSDFARFLVKQNRKIYPHDSIDDLKDHYSLVLDNAVQYFRRNEREQHIANVKTALAEATSNEEIIKLLQELENLK